MRTRAAVGSPGASRRGARQIDGGDQGYLELWVFEVGIKEIRERLLPHRMGGQLDDQRASDGVSRCSSCSWNSSFVRD